MTWWSINLLVPEQWTPKTNSALCRQMMPQLKPLEHLVSRTPVAFLGSWSIEVCRTCYRIPKISYRQTNGSQSSGMWWPRKELLEWRSREAQPVPAKLTLLVGKLLKLSLWYNCMTIISGWIHEEIMSKRSEPARMNRPMKRTFLHIFLDTEHFVLLQQMVELLSNC